MVVVASCIVNSCSHMLKYLIHILSDFVLSSYLALLIICVYLPSDCAPSSSDYLNTVGELDGFIESQNANCNTLIVGDFNVDFSRQGSTTQSLQNFLQDNGLAAVDLKF